jgi:hypothetical protein
MNNQIKIIKKKYTILCLIPDSNTEDELKYVILFNSFIEKNNINVIPSNVFVEKTGIQKIHCMTEKSILGKIFKSDIWINFLSKYNIHLLLHDEKSNTVISSLSATPCLFKDKKSLYISALITDKKYYQQGYGTFLLYLLTKIIFDTNHSPYHYITGIDTSGSSIYKNMGAQTSVSNLGLCIKQDTFLSKEKFNTLNKKGFFLKKCKFSFPIPKL